MTEKVKGYISSNYEVELGDSIRRIFVLNDMDCPTCVRSLADFAKEQIDNPGSMILINSRGSNIDLESFEELRKINPNILIRHKVENEDSIFSKMGVIYLNNAEVDSIVKVDISNLVGFIREYK